jgi:dTDP-4-amino-4,6-dideoxygalactose transaminase
VGNRKIEEVMIKYVNPLTTFRQGKPPDGFILTDGVACRQLEQKASEYLGSKYAIAVSSGTMALYCLFRVLGLAGKKIIMPAFTWRSTAEAAIMAGAKPVFADINQKTYCMCPAEVEDLISPDSAICTVDCFGLPTDYEAFSELCEKYNVPFIVDSAHSFGAKYDNAPLGEFWFHCYSFSPTKVLIANEGGLITTNDEAVYAELKNTRRWAGRMTEYNASCALEGLKNIDDVLFEKRKIAQQYRAFAIKNGLAVQDCPVNSASTFKDIAVQLNSRQERDELRAYLEAAGIETRVYFTPATEFLDFDQYEMGGLTHTWRAYHRSLCLPSWPGVDVGKVLATLENFLSRRCFHAVKG